MSRFRVILDTNLSELFLVSILVRGLCDHLGMDATQTASVEVCAVEAVTNAIKHAYGNTSGHEVWLDVATTPERLDLSIQDQGRSMPSEQRRRLMEGSRVFEFDSADIKSVPEGGMGLEIIRQQMDEASYSVHEGVNCLRLTKYVNGPDKRVG